jgi:hypothetical protein
MTGAGAAAGAGAGAGASSFFLQPAAKARARVRQSAREIIFFMVFGTSFFWYLTTVLKNRAVDSATERI